MAKALDGIQVVEFSSHLGAAYAAMLPAEHGAHTVSVEPPGGAQDLGTSHFHILNRGERAIALDLDSVAGRGGAQALIRRAGVVIAGFTPSRLRASVPIWSPARASRTRRGDSQGTLADPQGHPRADHGHPAAGRMAYAAASG